VIHLDTHVVIWLAERRRSSLSRVARRIIERDELAISPMVALELETLHAVGRLKSEPDQVLDVAERAFSVARSPAGFNDVVEAARIFAWTRDPFDRLIVANAIADGVRLLTADGNIQRHFSGAVW
jgi:PIN domain nuclease of toxin-antitoxin system